MTGKSHHSSEALALTFKWGDRCLKPGLPALFVEPCNYPPGWLVASPIDRESPTSEPDS
jgi:hypothetical protein